MDLATWKSRLSRCRERIAGVKHGLHQRPGSSSSRASSVSTGPLSDDGLENVRRELDALCEAVSFGRVRDVASPEDVSMLRSKVGGVRRELEAAVQLSGEHGGKHAILQLQNDIIAQQDAALDDISGQLTRVSHIGIGIHDEVDLQSGLLDNLDHDVTQGNARVADAAHEAGVVADSSGTCKYWLAIAALLIMLIVLLVA